MKSFLRLVGSPNPDNRVGTTLYLEMKAWLSMLRKTKVSVELEIICLEAKVFLECTVYSDRIFSQLHAPNRMLNILLLEHLQVLHGTM